MAKIHPTFNRLYIKLVEVKAGSGLIHVSDERNPFAIAEVLSLGPMAFRREEGNVTHDIKIGDKVIVRRGEIATISVGFDTVKVVNDDAVISKIEL